MAKKPYTPQADAAQVNSSERGRRAVGPILGVYNAISSGTLKGYADAQSRFGKKENADLASMMVDVSNGIKNSHVASAAVGAKTHGGSAMLEMRKSTAEMTPTRAGKALPYAVGAASGAIEAAVNTVGAVPQKAKLAYGVAKEKAKGAVRDAEVGIAKTVGKAALNVRDVSNPLTRGAVDMAAYAAPRATTLAGAKAIAGATKKQIGSAVGSAAYDAADKFFKGVGGVEKAVGKAAYTAADGAAKGFGRVEHAAAEAVKGAASRVASAFARKPQAAPETNNAFVAKNEQQNKMNLGRAPQQTSAATGKDGPEKTSASGSKGTYQTLDGRAVDGTPAQQAAWSARRKTA